MESIQSSVRLNLLFFFTYFPPYMINKWQRICRYNISVTTEYGARIWIFDSYFHYRPILYISPFYQIGSKIYPINGVIMTDESLQIHNPIQLLSLQSSIGLWVIRNIAKYVAAKILTVKKWHCQLFAPLVDVPLPSLCIYNYFHFSHRVICLLLFYSALFFKMILLLLVVLCWWCRWCCCQENY